jgi:hypothetical protein
MASTYSSLKIELIATGEQSGTWGTTTNTNLGTALGQAITGSSDVAFSSADVTLTLTDTNASQSARALRLNLTGTSGGARNLIVPAIQKQYIINNGLADAVTVKNSTGTGIAVAAGKTMIVFNDSTNVVDVNTYLTSLTLGSALPVASGGTGLTSLTANYIPYGNGTSALSNSSTFTYNGTSLTLGATSARVLGDFTNATISSRLAFQTSTANSTTGIYAVPSGTGTAASWQATNTADPTNTSKILIATNGSTDVQLVSGINGTGTYLPMTFYNNGAEKARLSVAGGFSIGSTTDPGAGGLQVAGTGFFPGSTSVLGQVVTSSAEITTISATAATGALNFDVSTQSVLYYTTSASANWTMNFRMSSTVALNTAMSTGQAVTVVFAATQGATAYYATAITIDGNAVTPKWQGGTAPAAGNASSVDVYSYTIIKTGSAAFTVLASQTQFK